MTLESGWLKSLRHVAMVAKFVDETSLKKWLWTVSNFLDRIQFLLIGQMSAKLSEVESERTVFDFRKRKRKFLPCVHQLHKAGAWNEEAFTPHSCNNGLDICKKAWCIFKVAVLLIQTYFCICRSHCCRRLKPQKIGRPRSGSPICLLIVTSMIKDRIGRHEVLLPINHSFNKIFDISI